MPDYCMYLGAFAIQWFSIHDILDGMRARRLKAGSPLGRVIDEGKNILRLSETLRDGYHCNDMSRELFWICTSIRYKFDGIFFWYVMCSVLFNGT